MTLISRLVFFTEKNTAKCKSSHRIKTTEISVVIPVKDNQKGINTYLQGFLNSQLPQNYPKEIIIVDNNSDPPLEINPAFLIHGLQIILICCSRPGPAAARNEGAKFASGKWLLFNDSDCIPTEMLLTGYLEADNSSLAYAGNVKALGSDKLSCYYESQEILIPLKTYGKNNLFVPQYLITANSLIWREAFLDVNGFNENITLAGGEDVDLGIRLSQMGELSYAFESIVLHDFSDGWKGFRERFIRYGQGNRMVAALWNVDLRPRPFRPNKRTLFNELAAILQFVFLTVGYVKQRGLRFNNSNK